MWLQELVVILAYTTALAIGAGTVDVDRDAGRDGSLADIPGISNTAAGAAVAELELRVHWQLMQAWATLEPRRGRNDVDLHGHDLSSPVHSSQLNNHKRQDPPALLTITPALALLLSPLLSPLADIISQLQTLLAALTSDNSAQAAPVEKILADLVQLQATLQTSTPGGPGPAPAPAAAPAPASATAPAPAPAPVPAPAPAPLGSRRRRTRRQLLESLGLGLDLDPSPVLQGIVDTLTGVITLLEGVLGELELEMELEKEGAGKAKAGNEKMVVLGRRILDALVRLRDWVGK